MGNIVLFSLEKMHASAFGQIKTVYNECMTILISPDLSSTNYLLTISSSKKTDHRQHSEGLRRVTAVSCAD